MQHVTRHPSLVTNPGTWTIIPVRGIAAGKSRLAPALDPAARARLNRWLLAHTLDAVAGWRADLERCIVVSPCGETLQMAARRGAATISESGEGMGVNAAAALGASYAAARGAESVLVLPCDLPLLAPEALAALAQAAAGSPLAIAPDRSGSGTNALLVSLAAPFESRFGADSYARHALLAVERGWLLAACRRPELEFDLDTPEDLAAWPMGPEIAAEHARPG